MYIFNPQPDARVFHLMGEPADTKHLVVANEQAISSPGWSIHSVSAPAITHSSGRWVATTRTSPTWIWSLWKPFGETAAMTTSFDLRGKNAIVTGANTGLGRGFPGARKGGRFYRGGVGRSSMDETERLCGEAGARFHSIRADLSTIEPIERIVAESADIGRIDILVNNAGIIRGAGCDCLQ